MLDVDLEFNGKVALITGAAHRIGAAIARHLHQHGMRIAVHYHRSETAAVQLATELEGLRPSSIQLLKTDLLDTTQLPPLVAAVERRWGRLDVLINNASSFFPTALGKITEPQWNDLLGSNLKAPLFLSQAAAPLLKEQQGCIVNITDIHAERPLKGYSVYCIAKAGLWMLTKSLARELAPEVRVNAIAPGAVLWPDTLNEETQRHILERIPLRRRGDPNDIAHAVKFLITGAPYVTGEVITVDGGRSINN
jgi:pteridine reductase